MLASLLPHPPHSVSALSVVVARIVAPWAIATVAALLLLDWYSSAVDGASWWRRWRGGGQSVSRDASNHAIKHTFTLPWLLRRAQPRRLPDGFRGAIGRTPLVRLSGLSTESGCEILGKCEFLNPGGSVKDRVANRLIDEALGSGQLRPGGWVTEATAVRDKRTVPVPVPVAMTTTTMLNDECFADYGHTIVHVCFLCCLSPRLITPSLAPQGSTGISLTLACHARGLRAAVVLPDDVAVEKADLLRALQAEVGRLRREEGGGCVCVSVCGGLARFYGQTSRFYGFPLNGYLYFKNKCSDYMKIPLPSRGVPPLSCGVPPQIYGVPPQIYGFPPRFCGFSPRFCEFPRHSLAPPGPPRPARVLFPPRSPRQGRRAAGQGARWPVREPV